jgi:hypothetical protein
MLILTTLLRDMERSAVMRMAISSYAGLTETTDTKQRSVVLTMLKVLVFMVVGVLLFITIQDMV